MKISHIRIQNILGIEDLEFTPGGSYTQISGRNGESKTSILEVIKSAFKAGSDATLLRKGAESGQAVILLDDGTEIISKATPDGSATAVRQNGKLVKRPVEVLRGLSDMMSVNPVDFISASKKDRARVLLEAMPIAIDVERLKKIAGVDVAAPEGMHALAILDNVAKQVYDDRTGTNRAIKEKEGTINQIRLAMPDAPDGVDGDETRLAADIASARDVRDSRLSAILNKHNAIKADTAKSIDAIKTKLQADIDKLREAAEADIEKLRAEEAEQTDRANKARAAAHEKYTAETQAKQVALESIRANRTAVAKRQGAQETIGTLQAEVGELAKDAERQTQALAAIEAYKAELLSSLPIPGLEVRDGEIYRDGITLDRLNTAQQVQIAVQVAALRAGEIRIACVDRLESLDKESREELRKAAKEANLQLFVTRVTDEPFKIATAK